MRPPVAVFACQQPDGTYVIDICTRDDTADGRLRLLLDGQPLPGTPAARMPGQHCRSAGPAGAVVPDPGRISPCRQSRHRPDPGLNHRPRGVAG